MSEELETVEQEDTGENTPEEQQEGLKGKVNELSRKLSTYLILLTVSLAIHLFILLILALIPGEEYVDEKKVVIITEIVEEVEEEEAIEEIEEMEISTEVAEVETEPVEDTPVEEVQEIEEPIEEEVEELEMILEPEIIQNSPSLDIAVLGFSGMPKGASAASGLLAGRFSSAGKRKMAGAKNISIINDALKWLASQQKENGTWPCKAHPNAVNGAAALAFLGNGNSTHSGRYKDVVSKFVNFYIKAMPEDGGHGNHGHATPFVIMAMCDAYAMNNEDTALREYCELAISYVCDTQLVSGGWSGGGKTAKKESNEVDIAQSAWYIMALVSARLAGISYPDEVLRKARGLFAGLAQKSYKGQIKITSHGGQDDLFNRPHSSASYLATNLIFMGEKPNHSVIQAQAKQIFNTMPKKGQRNYWLLYNQGLGLFQMGPNSIFWKDFKNHILVDLRTEAKKDSNGVFWDNSHLYTKGNQKSDTGAQTSYWGDCGATAMAVLNLQVFFRYGELSSMLY